MGRKLLPRSRMQELPKTRSALRYAALAAGAAAVGYVAYAGAAWFRYGHARLVRDEEKDALLDQFMPVYEVAERHRILVHAPGDVAFAAACTFDLQGSPLIRAIFRARELALGAKARNPNRPRGLLKMLESLGWRILAEAPGREIVAGCITQPWEADVVFRPIPAEEYAAFHDLGWVKIAWTIRADPIDDRRSMVRTETRAVATDAASRRRFRRYWSLASPGIALIRRIALRIARRDAENACR